MPRGLKTGIAQDMGGGTAGIDGDGALFEQCFQPFDVIAVLMRDQDRVDVLISERESATEQLLGAETCIDEESGFKRLGERGIATAAAAEDCELHAEMMREKRGIGQEGDLDFEWEMGDGRWEMEKRRRLVAVLDTSAKRGGP
jgi:hypothetical protein